MTVQAQLQYPIRFKPLLRERIWGGSKLADILGKTSGTTHIGESWEISGVPGHTSIVDNGPLKGRSLREMIDMHGQELLGPEVLKKYGSEFPILIKFIDAEKDLSIQLHPGDELAKERHQSFGKTEMWYILDADKGAELIIGFNRDVTVEEYKKSLQDENLPELLNNIPVKEGDTFLINAGKVHAIGAGILLVEIQQTSDITYRLYDYNRRDLDGNKRELHTDLALDAIDLSVKDDYRVIYKNTTDRLNEMVSCPYFTTNFLKLEQDMDLDLSGRPSFSVYICVKGSAVLDSGNTRVPIKFGETVLIPANLEFLRIETRKASFLEVTV